MSKPHPRNDPPKPVHEAKPPPAATNPTPKPGVKKADGHLEQEVPAPSRAPDTGGETVTQPSAELCAEGAGAKGEVTPKVTGSVVVAPDAAAVGRRRYTGRGVANVRQLVSFVFIVPWTTDRMIDHEKTFLQYQRELRDGGTHLLQESMLVLDIIDVKAQSLLGYISVSLAALLFFLPIVSASAASSWGVVGTACAVRVLIGIMILLVIASILCLSCLNIVGAHTIDALSCDGKDNKEDYESHIVCTTHMRRKRYLIAHRISVLTALATLALMFNFLLAHASVPLPAGGASSAPGDAPTPRVSSNPAGVSKTLTKGRMRRARRDTPPKSDHKAHGAKK